MSITSYAQNFEDVMLARALADVPEGFYVDVGAQDPVVDSVTRLFYERGWHGINIEPVPHWFERVREDRPRDVNLMCAVGASEGELVLHEFADSGLTTASPAYADEHAAAGRTMVKRVVPMTRLDVIFDQHAPKDVHFLKIDVEGMEKEVLAGFSLARHRPWVLVVESTRPNSSVDVSDAWEPSVLGAGYRLVYRDGLNRFYLAEEHMSRAPAFDVPPNVFDDFIPYSEVASNDYAHSLEARLQALHDRAESLRADLGLVTDTAVARQTRLEELEIAVAERQSMFESAARTAEAYRIDLLQVSQTAHAQQERLAELEKALLDRQAMLEERAETAEAYRLDLLRAQAELNSVAEAAENRRKLIEALEARLADREGALHAALVEIGRIHASRSWRLTATLRIAAQLARRGARRTLRAASGIPLLRWAGGRLLKGRARQLALRLAGFSGPIEAGDPFRSAASGVLVGHVEMSRAGKRVYRLLSSARERGLQDQQ